MAEKRTRRTSGDGALYQRANGLWVGTVDLPDRDGKRRRRSVSSKDYATALQKLRQLRRDIEDGQEPVTDRTTLDKWLTEWLTIIKREVKPSTYTGYKSLVNKQIIPAIGSKKLGQLQPRDVRTMCDKIAAGRTTGTALNAYWVLSKALRQAVNEGMLRDNVCDRVSPPKVVRESRGSHELDQVRRILAYLAEHGDPDLTSRWCLSLFTGARQAECLGLEWDRIDFDTNLVDYSWTLHWLPLKERYGRQPAGVDLYDRSLFDVDPGLDFRPIWRTACLLPPKTAGSRRIVPMVEPLAYALQEHLQGSAGEGLVWVREGGRPWPRREDGQRWHNTLAAAKVPDLTLHSARHTVATLLQAAGVPEAVRNSILGHNTAAMARNYAYVDQTLTRDALATLQKALS